MSKRKTLDNFFTPKKKPREEQADSPAHATGTRTHHQTYPFAVPFLPDSITKTLDYSPSADSKLINDKPDLDLLYFAPFIELSVSKDLFRFLRSELFFYRVQYSIKRGSINTNINTPRYTTVFGVDETSRFDTDEARTLLEAATSKPTARDKYGCKPRPIPECLDALRRATEAVTGCKFNFCLVNYYASGQDSISYHSDDERFLGTDPAIASFSLGGRRDFLLRHKPLAATQTDLSGDERAAIEKAAANPLKLPLASGDMLLMRGRTQACWLHSIPKRKGGEADSLGRINITFRRALVKGGTENYYRYNVGDGPCHRWDDSGKQMKVVDSSG